MKKDEGQSRAMSWVRLLVGMWRGLGVAAFPTITTFEYREELEFTANATQPVLRYERRMWRRG